MRANVKEVHHPGGNKRCQRGDANLSHTTWKPHTVRTIHKDEASVSSVAHVNGGAACCLQQPQCGVGMDWCAETCSEAVVPFESRCLCVCVVLLVIVNVCVAASRVRTRLCVRA